MDSPTPSSFAARAAILVALCTLAASGCVEEPRRSAGDPQPPIRLLDRSLPLSSDAAVPVSDARSRESEALPRGDAGTPGEVGGYPGEEGSYPEDPLADTELVNSYPRLHEGTSSFGDGQGRFIFWAPSDYTPNKAWPLSVYLHGGGNTTGPAESESQAIAELQGVVFAESADKFIWLAPLVRVAGSYHAWAVKENTLDIIDGIREVAKRFHVDNSRVYLLGVSMGGGGTATISWIVPQAFAAYGPIAGYYWNDWCPVPSLKNIHYRLVHGSLDTLPYQPYDRLGLAEEFVSKSEAAGAEITKIIVSGASHTYPDEEKLKMNEFFLGLKRPSPTDWSNVREAVSSFANGGPL